MRSRALIALALPLVWAVTSPPLVGQSYTPVTDARLTDPEPENWLSYRGNYAGWGYSPLAQVNTANVRDLVPVWTFSTGILNGHESPPLVNDGVMFVTTPENHLLALDASSGELLWRYRYPLPQNRVGLHNTNRGVALYGDKVYLATLDARVVALDAASGSVVWNEAVQENSAGYYMTIAPLAARGKIMVGVSGGELGIRGFVVALDSETGDEVWRTYTIPAPGEPGNDTWPVDAWRTGGAPVWVPGHFDPELNLTYWGTGNPGPWIGDQRPGDNLYTNSVLAIDVDTGELKGYHQYHWNGSWDWDEVSTPLLIDVRRDGRTIPSLVHPGRNGYLWILERRSDGIGFVDAEPYVTQNVFARVDPETGRPTYNEDRKPKTGWLAEFCPSMWGGKDWPPAAYNPQTDLLYIPANENTCSASEGLDDVEYQPGRPFMGAATDFFLAPGADHIGELQAWNLHTGERVWTHEFPSSNWGPVLTTGGGLVFMGGTGDRFFRAFDALTGDVLWEQRTNSGIMGVPTTFEVDGVQYVAVQSGWGVDAARMDASLNRATGSNIQVPQGGVIWVFAVKD